ncbi:HIT family protein [Phenylobacterium sp.]|uniref:HIT family protein n=1 Tax=Phenylobacterium sp. TaxID=1871053 RepID=UPI002F95BBF3
MFSKLLLAAALLLQAPPAAPVSAPKAVPLGAAYDPTNPFARILAGSSTNAIVAETQSALAFMDYRPSRAGHVLVIPKSPTVSLLDATPQQLAGVMALARCVAIAQTVAFKADGITGISLDQNNGAPNQHVGHMHFHLIPNYGNRPSSPPATPLTKEQLEPVAARIRAAMPSEGC